MRVLARFVGVAAIVLGAVGIAAPQAFLAAVRSVHGVATIGVIAAIRVLCGLVLVRAASASRAPRSLRLLGFLAVLAGLVTPFFGEESIHRLLDWSTRWPSSMRVWGIVAAAGGAFIVYALLPAASGRAVEPVRARDSR